MKLINLIIAWKFGGGSRTAATSKMERFVIAASPALLVSNAPILRNKIFRVSHRAVTL